MATVRERLQKVVGQYLGVQAILAERQAVIDELAKTFRTLAEVDLPAIMAELGETECVLEDGTKVKVGEHLSASVADRNFAEARRIFKRLKAGDLVQVQVTAAFGERDRASLVALLEYSKKAKLPLEQRDVVNPASLKKWVREMKEEGKLQPEELTILGVHSVFRADVKEPKK